jgi:hypothetical protein
MEKHGRVDEDLRVVISPSVGYRHLAEGLPNWPPLDRQIAHIDGGNLVT